MTVTSVVVVPTNPVDQKAILDAVKEADVALISAAGYRSQVKAIVDKLHGDYPDIGKKYFNRMIRTYHKQNFSVIETESEDFSELYSTIVK